jgi:hypothetical protein
MTSLQWVSALSALAALVAAAFWLISALMRVPAIPLNASMTEIPPRPNCQATVEVQHYRGAICGRRGRPVHRSRRPAGAWDLTGRPFELHPSDAAATACGRLAAVFR